MTLGDYLKAKREAADLSQDELAERTGASQSAVSQWERGVRIPKSAALVALEKALPGAKASEMLALLPQSEAS